MSAPLVNWTAENNSVYVPELDEEHKVLFQITDDVLRALLEGAGLNSVEAMLRDLIARTYSHFSAEDKLMRSTQYPLYHWHKGQHDMVRAKLAVLERLIAKGDREAALEALDFLSAWLTTHTAVSDRMMGAHLRGHWMMHRGGRSKTGRIQAQDFASSPARRSNRRSPAARSACL